MMEVFGGPFGHPNFDRLEFHQGNDPHHIVQLLDSGSIKNCILKNFGQLPMNFFENLELTPVHNWPQLHPKQLNWRSKQDRDFLSLPQAILDDEELWHE